MENKDIKTMDFDTHYKILNFLSYLQGIGIINQTQRDLYASYIPEHLTEKEEIKNVLKDLFKDIK